MSYSVCLVCKEMVMQYEALCPDCEKRSGYNVKEYWNLPPDTRLRVFVDTVVNHAKEYREKKLNNV